MSDDVQNYDAEKIKRDNAALRKFAAIQKAANDLISVQKVYVDMTGDLEAAFVLDELIYFTIPRDGGKSGLRIWKDGYLWMAVARDDWWNRKRLSARQADTAVAKLIERGLVIKKVYKFNGLTAVHLRLNVDVFFKVYAETLSKHNPPESQDDTMLDDLQDLYEMMGQPFGVEKMGGNDESVNRELQNGDGVLQNGETFNSPHPSITNNPKKNVRAKNARTRPAPERPTPLLKIPEAVVPLYRKWVQLFGQEPVDYQQAMLWIKGSKRNNTRGLEFIAANGAGPDDLEWAWNKCKKDKFPVALPSTLVNAAIGHHKQFGAQAGAQEDIQSTQAARRAEIERNKGKQVVEEE